MKPDKFWAKVDKAPGHGPDGDCWVWSGATMPSGYGRCDVDRKGWLAHRWAMVLAGNDVADQVVCHRCDNPSCVRPDHLFVGSHADNVKDMVAKGRTRSTLTPEELKRIQLGLEPGTTKEIAARFGVAASTVSRVRSGQVFAERKLRIIDDEFEGIPT